MHLSGMGCSDIRSRAIWTLPERVCGSAADTATDTDTDTNTHTDTDTHADTYAKRSQALAFAKLKCGRLRVIVLADVCSQV